MSKIFLKGAAVCCLVLGIIAAGYYYMGSEASFSETAPVSADQDAIPEETLDEIAMLTEEIKNLEEIHSQAATEAETPKGESTAEASENFKTILEIEEGATAKIVTERLHHLQIISEPVRFREIFRENEATRQIQIGTYQLSSDMDYEEIISLITD